MLGLTAPPILISFAAFRTCMVTKWIVILHWKKLTHFRSRMPPQHRRLTLLKRAYNNLQVFEYSLMDLSKTACDLHPEALVWGSWRRGWGAGKGCWFFGWFGCCWFFWEGGRESFFLTPYLLSDYQLKSHSRQLQHLQVLLINSVASSKGTKIHLNL